MVEADPDMGCYYEMGPTGSSVPVSMHLYLICPERVSVMLSLYGNLSMTLSTILICYIVMISF